MFSFQGAVQERIAVEQMDFDVQFNESRKVVFDPSRSFIQVLHNVLSHYFSVDVFYQWVDNELVRFLQAF